MDRTINTYNLRNILFIVLDNNEYYPGEAFISSKLLAMNNLFSEFNEIR